MDLLAGLTSLVGGIQSAYEHASAGAGAESLYGVIQWLCEMSPIEFVGEMKRVAANPEGVRMCSEIRRMHDVIRTTTKADSHDIVKCLSSSDWSSEPVSSLCVRMVCACMCNVDHDHDVAVWMAMSYAERLEIPIPKKECECCLYHGDEHRKE
jgi:hypothetical protein